MDLRYKKLYKGFRINKSNIFYYKFFFQFKKSDSVGYYKNDWFGLNYWGIFEEIKNYPSGIKIG